MSARPRKRPREALPGAAEASVRLAGGHPEKDRTVAAYESGLHVDVEVRAADGAAFRAHGLVLMAGSDYFAAVPLG